MKQYSKAFFAVSFVATSAGITSCGFETVESQEGPLGETQEPVSSCTSRTADGYTFGEVRSHAITSMSNFNPPPGLADMKASIGSACARNSSSSNCACAAPSASDAPADKAAWQNISSATNGTDKSSGASYICVDTQSCSIVHSCAVANPTANLNRNLAPVSQLPLAQGVVYFYSDPTKGWCYQASEAYACSGALTHDANWTYNCSGRGTTFARGSNVTVLARFQNLTTNHRFRATISKNGVPQQTTTTAYNVVGSGWQQAYTWPQVQNAQPGNWTVQIQIDPGDGIFRSAQTVSFTVQ